MKRQATDQYLMDGHKLLWHLDRVNQWVRGERIAPLHIDLGVTTACNIACSYCYGILQGRSGVGTDDKGRFDMPTEKAMMLFDDAKAVGVRSIAFIGEGENTLHPDLGNMLDHCRQIKLDASLGTNGTLLKPDGMEQLLSALSWLRINISAASRETYKKIHGADAFGRVVRNTSALVEAKKRGHYDTTIGFQMVVTRDNMDDIVPLAKLGQELGVDYTVIKPCSDTGDRRLDAPDKEYLEVRGLFEQAEKYSTDHYSVLVKWQKLTNLGRKDFDVCYGTQFITAISGDGGVYPCGHFFKNEDYCMGNVLDTSFGDIVQSDRYWAVQNRIQRLDVNKDCETNCRQYYIDRFLWTLRNPPAHVNFV